MSSKPKKHQRRSQPPAGSRPQKGGGRPASSDKGWLGPLSQDELYGRCRFLHDWQDHHGQIDP